MKARLPFILGSLTALVALLFYLGVLSFNPAAALPNRMENQKLSTSLKLLLTSLAPPNKKDAVTFSISKISNIYPGIHALDVSIGHSQEFPIYSIGNGKYFILGDVYQLQGDHYANASQPARPQHQKRPNLNLSAAVPDDHDLLPASGRGPALYEYISLHCPACAVLSPVFEQFSATSGGRGYTKILVNDDDKSSLAAFAILSALRPVSTPAFYQRVKSVLQRLVTGGATPAEISSFMSSYSVNNESPDVLKALQAKPDDKTKAEADRVRREFDKVGIVFTPTFIIDGKEVPATDPAKLASEFRQALTTPRPSPSS